VPKTAFYFIRSAMTWFTTSVFLSRNRVSPKEAFEGLELCERKLSCTVLRGLDGSNPVRLLGNPRTGMICEHRAQSAWPPSHLVCQKRCGRRYCLSAVNDIIVFPCSSLETTIIVLPCIVISLSARNLPSRLRVSKSGFSFTFFSETVPPAHP
jgi:hypothetical protein